MNTETPQKMGVGPIILLLIGLTTISAGVWFSIQLKNDRPPQLDGASVYPAPVPVEEFHLIDHRNQPLGPQRLRGQWTFAFFGYTNCPDICPNTLTVLSRVIDLLAREGASASEPQVLFISVDPERDTAEKLEKFVHYFNQEFVAATGTIEQLQKVTKQFGTMFERTDNSGAGYEVNHGTSIMLFSPRGELVAKFPAWAQTPEKVLGNFSKIRDYYGG